MHVDIVDNHLPCKIKLMASPLPGDTTDTNLAISGLSQYLNHRGHSCEEYLTDKTVESVKRKYSKLTKFYYPNSLYVKVTVRPHTTVHVTLTLNVDNIHVLDIYTPSVTDIADYETIADVLIHIKKKYRYLL